jgi:antitoxin FitA
MAVLTIKNMPDDLYEALRDRARAHRRSINGEAIVCLEQVLRGQAPDEARLLARVQVMREASAVYLSETALREAIAEGRP